MRYYELLEESKYYAPKAMKYNPAKIESLQKTILTKCSDYFKMVGGKGIGLFKPPFLFRGMDKGMDIFSSSSPKNRTRSDTAKYLQKEIDKRLIAAGFTATRGNSIFCSGNRTQAYDYGEIYIIFPMNGFTFTWSSKLRDFYSKIEDGTFDVGSYETEIIIPSNLVKKYKFSNTNLKAAIKSKNEIYIHGKYIAVREDSNLFELLRTPPGARKRSLEEINMEKVLQNHKDLRKIENPSEAVQLAAISKAGYMIRWIKNPSEAVQLAAISQSPDNFYEINKPTPKAMALYKKLSKIKK